MRMAIRIGISIKDFWEMTPFELFICIESFEDKEKERSKELIIQAYYTEAFARMKKLPKLKDLLKEKKKQSNKEMLEVVKRLNAMMGGEVIGGS